MCLFMFIIVALFSFCCFFLLSIIMFNFFLLFRWSLLFDLFPFLLYGVLSTFCCRWFLCSGHFCLFVIVLMISIVLCFCFCFSSIVLGILAVLCCFFFLVFCFCVIELFGVSGFFLISVFRRFTIARIFVLINILLNFSCI